jgi:hypothetical protein
MVITLLENKCVKLQGCGDSVSGAQPHSTMKVAHFTPEWWLTMFRTHGSLEGGIFSKHCFVKKENCELSFDELKVVNVNEYLIHVITNI